MIDRETVDRIYAAANIVEIIGEYVTLKRKGVNYQACCPFHNEKTPSFVVSPSKGLYKCFGCGKGGNAVTFIMEHEGVSYPEALKMVAKRYGIEVKERELTEEEQHRNDDRESMFALNGWAADYFASYLAHDAEDERRHDLFPAEARHDRRHDPEVRPRILPLEGRPDVEGCAGGGIQAGVSALDGSFARTRERRLALRPLPRPRDLSGAQHFGPHRGFRRPHAPHGQERGQVPELARERNLQQETRALRPLLRQKAIQQKDCAILVEGYFDVISMHQAGVENVVASSGTSLTTEQIRLVGRFTKNITVIYDGDAAGIHAAIRGIDMILAEGLNVRVVLLPPDDPDTFAHRLGAAGVEEYIRTNEQDFLSFKARLLMDRAEGDPIRKAALVGDMVQSIARIPDPIQRSVYIKECARTMDVDETILVSEVARKRMASTGDRETDEFVRRQTARQRAEQAAEPAVEFKRQVEAGSSPEALERELAKYLLKYGHCSFDFKEGRTMVSCNVAEVIFNELDSDNLVFGNRLCNELLNTYRTQWQTLGTGTEVPAHWFLNHPDPEVCNLAVDLLTSDDNYVPSVIWKRKDIHIETEAEMLAVGVPKAVTLYKSKVIERLIAEQQARLADATLSEEEQQRILRMLSKLNGMKVTISKKLQRLIL